MFFQNEFALVLCLVKGDDYVCFPAGCRLEEAVPLGLLMRRIRDDYGDLVFFCKVGEVCYYLAVDSACLVFWNVLVQEETCDIGYYDEFGVAPFDCFFQFLQNECGYLVCGECS